MIDFFFIIKNYNLNNIKIFSYDYILLEYKKVLLPLDILM